jgi:hypothetical protein
MGRAPARPARHIPLDHLYLRLHVIPFSAEGVGEGASSPYSSPRIRPTLAPTSTCAVAIVRPRGHFTACAHHLFRHRRTSHSSSRPSPYSSSPICCPYPRSQPQSDRRLSTRVQVGLAPGLSPYLPSRGYSGAYHA